MEDRKILVVKRDLLFEIIGSHFNGFREADDYNLICQIENVATCMNQEIIETDPRFKQLIGYTAILHCSVKLVFAYRRAKKKKDYKEKRLQGKWS